MTEAAPIPVTSLLPLVLEVDRRPGHCPEPPAAVVVLLVVAIVGLALTELTSNTATAAAFFPIFGAVAVGIGMDPLLMTITVTLAACRSLTLCAPGRTPGGPGRQDAPPVAGIPPSAGGGAGEWYAAEPAPPGPRGPACAG